MPAGWRWNSWTTGWSRQLSDDAVVVVMSNDEQAAEQAWKRLAVQRVNAYVLAGGVNRWLDLYHNHTANVPGPDHPATGDDRSAASL